MQETQVWSLGLEDFLEKAVAVTLVFLPGKSNEQRSLAGYIQSMGSQRVRHDWATEHTNGLKPGLEKSVPYWAPEIFECVCLFVCSQNETVLHEEQCLKLHNVKNFPLPSVSLIPSPWSFIHGFFLSFISAAASESWNCTLQQGFQCTLKNQLTAILPAQTKHLSVWAPPRWRLSAPE